MRGEGGDGDEKSLCGIKVHKALRGILQKALSGRGRSDPPESGGLLSGFYEGYARPWREYDGKNMLDWFTILAFYEASDRRMDGETLLEIKRLAVERLRFLGRLVDGNKSRWLYRLFEKTYVRFRKMQKKHQARGEWMDSWRVEINPDHRTEGFCFHLVGCPIAKHAREHGYTATRSCCRICAGQTISLRRSCTRALSGRRPRRSAARAAITGMWAIGARRCGTMRSCRRSERKKGKSAGQGVPVPRSFAAFACKERKSLHLPQQSGSMTKE